MYELCPWDTRRKEILSVIEEWPLSVKTRIAIFAIIALANKSKKSNYGKFAIIAFSN